MKVPFADEDEAKEAVKARWDAKVRRWYVPHDTSRHLVEWWL
ncbi:DUF5710 domain-containing protein [Actinosynnema sp. NPDC091369]